MSALQDVSAQSVPQEQTGWSAWPPLLRILTIASAIGIVFGLYMALVYAGTDVTQGDVQRIFYVHMPSFFGAFVAFGAAVVGGIQYLRTQKLKWDTLALAGAEIGLAFGLVNLVTGSIWARPIWNTWWTWDPRLTSAAIMCLTYAAYLMLRSGIENPQQRRRFAAIYGILAFATVILTVIIIRIRPDTIHPAVIGPSAQNAQGEIDVTQGVAVALMSNFPIWSLLVPITFMWHRIRLQNRIEQVAARKAEVLNA